MYIKRILEYRIRQDLDEPEATFIIGSRQVGKTTLMKQIASLLPAGTTFSIDLEDHNNRRILNQGTREFKAFLDSRELNRSNRNYIFIDEIQYAEDFSSTIKYFVDHYSDEYKLIMSGSSAVKIKSGFEESLVGRKSIFELFPLTFSEFCRFRGLDKLSDELEKIDLLKLSEDPLRFDAESLIKLLKDFMIFGGYPKAALKETDKAKKKVIKDIAESYILKDIRHLFHFEKVEEFNHLVRLLAIITGKEINLKNLGNEVKLNYRTLLNYLRTLEDSFIISEIRPFHKNKANELRKQPKIYFLDNGLRNYFINNFNDFEIRTDSGELLESFVFSQLRKRKDEFSSINFWKTTSGNEVDFIVRDSELITAYEIKKRFKKKNHLSSFKKKYPSAETAILALDTSFKAGSRYPLYLV